MQITKTRIQLVNAAASKLQIVGTGQNLEAEYFDILDSKVDPLLMQLAFDQICNVANDDEIPSEWFEAIAGLLANVAAPDFGKQFSPDLKFFYEMQLKRLTATRTTNEVLAAEYF